MHLESVLLGMLLFAKPSNAILAGICYIRVDMVPGRHNLPAYPEAALWPVKRRAGPDSFA